MVRVKHLIAIAAVFLLACNNPQEPKQVIIEKESKDSFPVMKDWKTSTPEKLGLNADTLQKMYERFGKGGSIVIIKDGYLISENYPEPYDTNYMHHIHSCSKSVTSILAGIAIDKGIIGSEHDSLLNYFKDYSIENSNNSKESITLHHVLSMSSGLDWKGGIGGADLLEMLRNQPDWSQYILNRPMKYKPGARFNYNSGGTHLISAIIQRESKITTKEFGRKYLFEPLGIKNFSWDHYVAPEGITPGAWGVHLSVRDMAKIGYLFLNDGKWGDNQIVSKEWVEKSVKTHIGLGKNENSYGYQWWILNGYFANAYSARGWYGDHYAFITVVPEYNLVVAIAGNISYRDEKIIVRDYVIPAMEKF